MVSVWIRPEKSSSAESPMCNSEAVFCRHSIWKVGQTHAYRQMKAYPKAKMLVAVVLDKVCCLL